MGLDTGLSGQQKTIVFASWFGWALDGYDLVLMLFVISSVQWRFDKWFIVSFGCNTSPVQHES